MMKFNDLTILERIYLNRKSQKDYKQKAFQECDINYFLKDDVKVQKSSKLLSPFILTEISKYQAKRNLLLYKKKYRLLLDKRKKRYTFSQALHDIELNMNQCQEEILLLKRELIDNISLLDEEYDSVTSHEEAIEIYIQYEQKKTSLKQEYIKDIKLKYERITSLLNIKVYLLEEMKYCLEYLFSHYHLRIKYYLEKSYKTSHTNIERFLTYDDLYLLADQSFLKEYNQVLEDVKNNKIGLSSIMDQFKEEEYENEQV